LPRQAVSFLEKRLPSGFDQEGVSIEVLSVSCAVGDQAAATLVPGVLGVLIVL